MFEERLRAFLTSPSIRGAIPPFFFLVGVVVAAAVAAASGASPALGVLGILVVAGLLAVLVREILESEADAYRELDQALVQLEEAEEIAQMGYWTQHLPDGPLEWSDSLYNLYGLEPDEFSPDVRTFLEAVHPEDRAEVEEIVGRDPPEGTIEPFTHRITRSDGDVRWLQHRGEVQTDDEGRPVKVVGTTTDVTERMALETDLKEAQRIAELGSWSWDLASGAVTWSDEQYRLFGREPGTPSEPSFEAFLECVHPKDRDRVEEAINHALEEGFFPPFEYRTIHPDGTTLWLAARGEVDTRDGEVVEVHGTNLDVTRRKTLIRDLEEARNEAEAASRAKSRFLANTSHELRTPLNAIQGFASLLLGTEVEADQREPLEVIQNSSEHLARLVDDILDISRIEAGKLQLDERPYDLRATLEETVQLLATKAGEKGIELVYDHGPEVPEVVEGDPDRLRQILVNLLSNAIKFTKDGHVTLRVRSREPEDGEGSEVLLVFEVEDTGVGIPEDELETLFQPFQQVDDSFTRAQEGSGLGLAITHELVNLMAGDLDVETAVGDGSTFTVTIPAERAAEQPVPVWRTDHEALEGTSILVVDDNPATRDLLVRLTEAWGMDPTSAASADEALDHIASHDVSLVLLDQKMPGTTGIEAARRIREDLGRTDLSLVLMAPLPGTRHQADESGLGFADVLLKPVTPSNLLEACRRAMGRQGQEEPEEDDPLDRNLRSADLDVLVVDDHAVNRLVVTRMLERLGVRNDTANDGEEALEALAQDDYDLVLMDIQMPVLDGLDATRQIRQRAGGRNIPRIVALTAHASPDDRQRCLDAGMDGYMGKPIDIDALVGTLEDVANGDDVRAHPSGMVRLGGASGLGDEDP